MWSVTPRARRMGRVLLETLAVALLLAAATYIFLLPASEQLFTKKYTGYIGDGGQDSQWLPMEYSTIVETWKRRPWLQLYGAMFSPQIGAPLGSPLFIPWIERILVGLVALVQQRAEPLITLTCALLVICNGLSMYLFGRTMKWSRLVSFALAFAWAFNPYTRARIDVHTSLAAPITFPLLFTAMRWVHDSMDMPVREARGLRIKAALVMIVAFFAPHYYWFVALLMAPVFLGWFIMTRPKGTSRLYGVGTLALTSIPSALFLAWNVLVPAPKSLLVGAKPAIGVYNDDAIHYALAAKPADFLAGDVRFSLEDYMPLRAASA